MPSFRTGSQLDYFLKRDILVEAFKLLCHTKEHKRAYLAEKKAKMEERLLRNNR